MAPAANGARGDVTAPDRVTNPEPSKAMAIRQLVEITQEHSGRRWHPLCTLDAQGTNMRQTNTSECTSERTMSLGEVIAASCELGYAVAVDGTHAMDLAARHLARVLARGRNAKLVHALTVMAQEFPVAAGPVARRSPRPVAVRRPVDRAA